MTLVTPNVEKTAISPPKLLVFGCGYLGIRIAKASVSAGHVVWTTTRRGAKADEMAKMGLRPILADWTDRRTLAELPEVDRVVVAVAYDHRSGLDRQRYQVDGFRHLLSAVPPKTHLCYISSTGVYHQKGGVWVDETSPTHPAGDSGWACLRAEGLLHRFRPDSPWTILRLAGIYGPGRVPRAANVIAGRPIRSPADGYLNLIHVDDAAAVALASWQSARQRIYVVADDQPVIRGDFYREIARQCGAAQPRFLPPSPGSPLSLRSKSNKRVWNRRMKRDLLGKLRFPGYREGLADVLGRGK